MTVISKPLYFTRYLMPIVVVLFIALFIFVTLNTGEHKKSLLPIIVPIFMLVMFVFVFKKFVWDLATEVVDNGDSLTVEKSGSKIELPLANIINVSTAMMQNPPRVTLRLREPCIWGDEISFCPLEPGFALIRTRSAIADDLILRIDKIRM